VVGGGELRGEERSGKAMEGVREGGVERRMGGEGSGERRGRGWLRR